MKLGASGSTAFRLHTRSTLSQNDLPLRTCHSLTDSFLVQYFFILQKMLSGAGQLRCQNGIAWFRRPCFRPANQRSCYHSKPLLKPQRPLKHSKAPPSSTPDLSLPSYGWKRNPFARTLSALTTRWRTILVFWAGLTASIYTYVAVDASLIRENVHISGRSRYAGSERQNAFYAVQLQRVAALEKAAQSHAATCSRCKPKFEENLLPGDDPLVMRVRRVFARLATAAGIEPESFSILVNKQPGMQTSIAQSLPRADGANTSCKRLLPRDHVPYPSAYPHDRHPLTHQVRRRARRRRWP